jgi:hypothetical protein
MVYGVLRYFQQYFSYIVAEETGVPGENHRPVASHYLYYRKNVVLANFDWLYVRFKIEESIFFMILFAYSHFTMNVLQEVIYTIKIVYTYIVQLTLYRSVPVLFDKFEI